MRERRASLHFVLAAMASLAAAILPLGAGGPGDGPAKSTVQRATGFNPKHDGFGFRNVFKGSPLPASLREATSAPLRAVKVSLGAGLGLPSEFGLCGGMSIGAADFYLANMAIPTLTSPPEQGSTLYEYLYQRQADSMGELGVMALKFWRWMNLPDHSLTGESTFRLTAKELPGIVSRLKAHQLVPIGLVLTNNQDGGKLWDNHQVLAFAQKDAGNGAVDISIYDPNFPSDDKVVIHVSPTEAKAGADTVQSEVICKRVSGKGVSKKVRGFFAMPYEPKTPPAGLSGVKPKPAA